MKVIEDLIATFYLNFTERIILSQYSEYTLILKILTFFIAYVSKIITWICHTKILFVVVEKILVNLC